MLLLEPEDAHAEGAGRGEAVLEAFGDGAEVLAEDDGLVAVGFEGDEAEHVLEGEGEVCAVVGGGAVGHDPEAGEAEGVVDADAAGVLHGVAEHLDEGAVAVVAEAAGGEGGEAPALALGAQQVGGERRW